MAEGTAEGSGADKPRAPHREMPVAWLSEPLPSGLPQSCSIVWKQQLFPRAGVCRQAIVHGVAKESGTTEQLNNSVVIVLDQLVSTETPSGEEDQRQALITV